MLLLKQMMSAPVPSPTPWSVSSFRPLLLGLSGMEMQAVCRTALCATLKMSLLQLQL